MFPDTNQVPAAKLIDVILAGTPVAQLIPYKRENWKSLKDKSVLVESQHSRAPMKELILEGWYRKNVWKKKTYQ